MSVHLACMCIVMPQNNNRWPLREHVQSSSRLLSLTFICARDAIMCIRQHNYQTTTAQFSLIYHSKYINYHADWSIILYNRKEIFKWGPSISASTEFGQVSTWCMDPKDIRIRWFQQTLKSVNFLQWESDVFPLSWFSRCSLKHIHSGYILSSVFRGQILGSRTSIHNHGANKQCQVCKH